MESYHLNITGRSHYGWIQPSLARFWLYIGLLLFVVPIYLKESANRLLGLGLEFLAMFIASVYWIYANRREDLGGVRRSGIPVLA